MSNSSLSNARKQKNDEFYTLYEDIEKEIHREEYLNFLKDKIVYCNCDDPSFSNFWKYFHINFSKIGLKRLIATFYSDMSYKMEYNGGDDDNIEAGTKTNLQGNGDFRSEECIDILKKVDVVITNPPFSLFREYISQLVEYEKKFLIIGNKNAIKYTEVFPLIKNNKVWLGARNMSDGLWFVAPKNVKKERDKVKNDVLLTEVPCCWYTNIPIKHFNEYLSLTKVYKGNEEKYPKYDYINAINIDKTSDIPYDYEGVMGVPISFLNKWNYNQFEIIDIVNRYCMFDSQGINDLVKLNKQEGTAINGIPKYARILIRKKQEKKKNYALIQGDCLEVMKHIPSASVDLILCDLPYGVTACNWDIVIPFDKLWEQYKRIIKPNGAIALFGTEPFSSKLRMSNLEMYKYDWIWEKQKPSNFPNMNFQCGKITENISMFSNGKTSYTPNGNNMKYYPQKEKREKPRKANAKMYGDTSKSIYHSYKTTDNFVEYEYKLPTNILRFNTVTKDRLHPTQKPVELLEYLIKTYTNEGDLVLDNCMGVGSCGVACLNTNRRFLGIELDENYFNIAKERIEKTEKDL